MKGNVILMLGSSQPKLRLVSFLEESGAQIHNNMLLDHELRIGSQWFSQYFKRSEVFYQKAFWTVVIEQLVKVKTFGGKICYSNQHPNYSFWRSGTKDESARAIVTTVNHQHSLIILINLILCILPDFIELSPKKLKYGTTLWSMEQHSEDSGLLLCIRLVCQETFVGRIYPSYLKSSSQVPPVNTAACCKPQTVLVCKSGALWLHEKGLLPPFLLSWLCSSLIPTICIGSLSC